MIRSFRDSATEDLFDGKDSKRARKALPVELVKVARRKLDALHAAAELADMAAPPNNKLKALKGDREGQHSIRINDQYRLCFEWTERGPENVEVTDYH